MTAILTMEATSAPTSIDALPVLQEPDFEAIVRASQNSMDEVRTQYRSGYLSAEQLDQSLGAIANAGHEAIRLASDNALRDFLRQSGIDEMEIERLVDAGRSIRRLMAARFGYGDDLLNVL